MIRGRVKTTYDPKWKGIEDVDDFTEGLGNLVDTVYTSLEELLARLGISEGDYEEETIDFDIADIVVNENEETVIIGTNGEERNIGTANNTVVTDGNGDKIAVNKDGETGVVRTNEESTARPNVYFKRLQDGLSGEKNIYGYDEVDESNFNDDHISVENGKITFCDIKFKRGSKIEDVFLESEDSLSIKAIFENNKVKIQSLYTGNKIEKKIYAKSKMDSTIVAMLSVNSYKLISIDGKIYSLFKQGDNSTKTPNNLNANTIKTDANKYLKYLIVNINTLDLDIEIPVDFDLNGNGELDVYKNGTNVELDRVWKKLVKENGLGFNDIVRVKDYLNRMWVIDSSTVIDQKYIMMPGNGTNKGFDLTKVDEYSIQSPTGGSKETINIDSIVGNKVYLKSTLRYVHPKTNNPMTSHIITSKAKTAGLSARDNIDELMQRPALTCGDGDVTNSLMAIRISHELMHGKGLRDVNDSKNIMHYTISGQSINNKKPYRYKELDPVITGTPILDRSKPKQNQWNIINRQ